MYYKPKLFETFIETFLKPLETFYANIETNESQQVSQKFHL
jgi:hypothetical protein